MFRNPTSTTITTIQNMNATPISRHTSRAELHFPPINPPTVPPAGFTPKNHPRTPPATAQVPA